MASASVKANLTVVLDYSDPGDPDFNGAGGVGLTLTRPLKVIDASFITITNVLLSSVTFINRNAAGADTNIIGTGLGSVAANAITRAAAGYSNTNATVETGGSIRMQSSAAAVRGIAYITVIPQSIS